MASAADRPAPAEPIPVGVVGVGHLGRHHARLYAASPAARLVAVVDRDRERACAVADAHGCAAFDDPRALVGRVRAASVAVPTEFHRGVAEPLLAAGLDLLIEKPLARSVEEADAILAAAGEDSVIMVGHTERFNPAVRALERAVVQPRFFEIHRLAAFSGRSTDIDVIFDLMIHDLDLLLHLDGTSPVTVHAVGVAALTDKIDLANARIRMASGCVANLTASRVSAESQRRVRVFQSRTYLACDTAQLTVERVRLVEGTPPRIERDTLPVEPGEPLALEIETFLNAVATRSRPVIDGRQARQALALGERVRRAIASPAQEA